MDSRVAFVVLLFAISAGKVFGQLTSTFYDSTCSNLTSIVRNVVQSAVNQEARTAASLLRLHFHDCFVQGCDASILLDDNDTFTGEKNAGPNKGSLRKYDVIDDIKTAVESSCPGTVSCADILAIAALESVTLMGGPSYTVQLGRRDSTTASFSSANSDLPRPSFNVSELVSNFEAKGLSTAQMVALSGAHTLGQAQCIAFRSRIYSNDSTVDQTYATNLQSNCPSTSGDGDTNLADLDVQSPNVFDSKYYKNLLSNEGLLTSDQVLYSTSGTTRDLVNSYATSQSTFFQDFGSAMIAMGNIDPLTGSNGEIRTNCRRVNS